MITSKTNAWFKRVQNALREHADEIVIEGPKAIDDAIAAGWTPIARPDFAPSLLKSLNTTAVALFERPRLTPDRAKLVVALDGVQDPGNVGTIVRLAAAFDAGGVILLPGCADPYGPKAIRASAGAILSVPIAEMSIDDLLGARPIFAADMKGSDELPDGILVLGSEGQGVSERIRAAAKLVGVKTSGRVESLNVAAAAAILLWRVFNDRQAAHRRNADRQSR
ncbi:MAG TPA: RNA methyltransferase [Thermoanaerobaculia bacterium]|nr:RNA methyltransferase [Thermoanaerobaculia bacterium]